MKNKVIDNRGISMVELLIAVAISVIIIGTAGYFLNTSIKNYFVAEDAIELQQQSQIFTEQLSKWCMEANYAEVYDTASGVEVLLIYHIPEYFDSTKWPHQDYHLEPGTTGSVRVIWKIDSNIYTASFSRDYLDASHDYPYLPTASAIDTYVTAQTVPANLLVEYVDTFVSTTSLNNVDPTGVSDAGVTETLSISLKLKKTHHTFEFSDEILIRNELNSQFKDIRNRMTGIR